MLYRKIENGARKNLGFLLYRKIESDDSAREALRAPIFFDNLLYRKIGSQFFSDFFDDENSRTVKKKI